MRLNSSPLNSAFSPAHPYVLQQVRPKTETWNNKLNRRYDTFRLQTIKLHHFPWISVCFICRFSLRLTHCFHSFPYPFRFFNDSADRCEWRLPLKHVHLLVHFHMIMCQVSIIAEICIRHAKICKTVLRYKTTLQIKQLQKSMINTPHHWSKESLRFYVLSNEWSSN